MTKTTKTTTPPRPKVKRSQPMIPKAGVTRGRRRYGCGGKLKK